MIYIFFAHHNEARLFIKELNLKKDMAFHQCELFRSDKVVLGVTGIGKVKAAIAVSLICSRMPPPEGSRSFNVGIAGGANSFQIGDLVSINKVTDEGSNRAFYPDMLEKVDLPEASLITVDKPILDREIQSGLIDMEGAGFFEASLKFFTQDRIKLLKVVSDYGLGVDVTRENVEGLMERNMGKITTILYDHG